MVHCLWQHIFSFSDIVFFFLNTDDKLKIMARSMSMVHIFSDTSMVSAKIIVGFRDEPFKLFVPIHDQGLHKCEVVLQK